ncbi:MAG: hypothetical protein JSV83_18320, partial [Desulfobacterales bacterium]
SSDKIEFCIQGKVHYNEKMVAFVGFDTIRIKEADEKKPGKRDRDEDDEDDDDDDDDDDKNKDKDKDKDKKKKKNKYR